MNEGQGIIVSSRSSNNFKKKHSALVHTLFVSQDSEEYSLAVFPCHQRSADRIVAGALRNGGLYIKLGQGLSTFNHILPRQYTDTLKSLLDKVTPCVLMVD